MDPGTLVAGRFEIVREAGRGGMASVHQAVDRQTGRAVALKLLHDSMDEFGERFRREAEVLARLSHPGIVGYVAHGEASGERAYLAMSWVDGETLGARLKRGPLSPAEAIHLGAHVADALAAAHAAGIVHRDVKPSNILLASGGFDRPVLVDFGVARVGDASAMTREGFLIGTPGFISPEQARGLLQIDARADQFSLGCVLYACLTARAPFRGEDLVGVLAKILFQETPRIRSERRDVPLDLDAVVAKAMAKEPSERFPDATALAAALRKTVIPTAEASVPSVAATTHAGISESEARLAAMVFVGRHPEKEDVAAIGTRFGGDVERLASGGLAVRFIELAGATERALAAARCALALRQHLPTAAISLATVRGSGSNDDLVKAIDRAAALAREVPRAPHTGPLPVRIDETTSGLLDARFDVRHEADGLELAGERPGDESRQVLGVAVPCIGRDRELLTLDATLAEVESEGIARAVVVTAEAGIGKSRLRREWMRRIRERDSDVTTWTARADPLDSRAPHGLIAQAIRRTVGIADDESLRVRQGRLREHLARVLPAAEVERTLPFLAELISAPFDDDAAPQLAAARADRKLMAEGIRRAFTTWLLASCTKPLLIVLDDAHWSDAATLRLLDAALEAAADRPLLVAIFARPALRSTHPALFAERRVQELRLEELPKRSAERLARAIVGPGAPSEVIDRVVALANGNAFFLEELLHAVADGKDVLPDSVLSVVEARLDALEPDARRVLRAASVFGQFFWPGGVAAVLGDTDEEATRTWIGALARREIVTMRGQSRYAGEPELTFRHALVRDTAYSMLTAGDRTLAHRNAAAWLEARGEQPAVLAAHLEAGADPGRAATQYMRAAEQMLGSGSVTEARELASRGLLCGPDATTRTQLLLLDAEASSWNGELEHATSVAEEVLGFALPDSDTYMRALGLAVLAQLKLGRLDRHRELVEIALRCLQQSPTGGAAGRLAATTGTAALFSGEVTVAKRIDALLDDLATRGELDAGSEAQTHAFRAFLSAMTGDLEGQVRHFDAAAACHEHAGDERSMLMHRANAGFARALVGDYEHAAAQLEAVLDAATQSRIEIVRRTAQCDLAGTLERMGRYAEACSYASEAIAGFRSAGDQRMECATRAYLARALLGLGDIARAHEEGTAALAMARNARQILPFALATMSTLELAASRVPQALAHAEEAVASLGESHTDGANDLIVRVAHVRALLAAGRRDEARLARDEAHALLEHRVSLIRDPRLVACYARVAENVALRKLGAVLGE